ncbi:hypothetical protein [Pseudomonas sp. v388]|uniref:hypothetical protein n=1 Tax=Pseudomonas sp. v388 TaxID=2479849 RepID=UPI000F7B3010|nr:hypothetical protein [Pseudomonas sp. v388]
MRLRSSQIKLEYDRSALEEVPIEVWYELVNDHPDYRQWVIHNKIVPLEILEYLYKIYSSLKLHIARKRKLSVELFERLSDDPDRYVRSIIAINRKTPLPLLERLMRDKVKDVAKSARRSHAERTKPAAPANNA